MPPKRNSSATSQGKPVAKSTAKPTTQRKRQLSTRATTAAPEEEKKTPPPALVPREVIISLILAHIANHPNEIDTKEKQKDYLADLAATYYFYHKWPAYGVDTHDGNSLYKSVTGLVRNNLADGRSVDEFFMRGRATLQRGYLQEVDKVAAAEMKNLKRNPNAPVQKGAKKKTEDDDDDDDDEDEEGPRMADMPDDDEEEYKPPGRVLSKRARGGASNSRGGSLASGKRPKPNVEYLDGSEDEDIVVAQGGRPTMGKAGPSSKQSKPNIQRPNHDQTESENDNDYVNILASRRGGQLNQIVEDPDEEEGDSDQGSRTKKRKLNAIPATSQKPRKVVEIESRDDEEDSDQEIDLRGDHGSDEDVDFEESSTEGDDVDGSDARNPESEARDDGSLADDEEQAENGMEGTIFDSIDVAQQKPETESDPLAEPDNSSNAGHSQEVPRRAAKRAASSSAGTEEDDEEGLPLPKRARREPNGPGQPVEGEDEDPGTSQNNDQEGDVINDEVSDDSTSLLEELWTVKDMIHNAMEGFFESINRDPNDTADLALNSAPPLDSLYASTLDKANWKNTIGNLQATQSIPAGAFLEALIARYLLENILDAKLPWQSPLHLNDRQDWRFVVPFLGKRVVEDLLVRAATEQSGDADFIANILIPKAQCLAQDLRLLLNKHLEQLILGPVGLGGSDADWHDRLCNNLNMICQAALEVRAYISIFARQDGLSWQWPSTDQEFDGDLMSVESVGEEGTIAFTMFPGLTAQQRHGQNGAPPALEKCPPIVKLVKR